MSARFRATALALLAQRRRRQAASRASSASRRTTLVLTGGLVVLTAVLLAGLAYLSPDTSGRSLTLDQVGALADQRRIVSAELRDEDAQVVGRYVVGTAEPAGDGVFTASYPKSDTATGALLNRLAASGARVSVDPQTGKVTTRLLLTVLLPLVVLANLFALLLTFSRGGGSGIGEVTDFSKSKTGEKTGDAGFGFGDVAGVGEAVVELREVVDYLKDPGRYQQLGATPPKGVLLFGPPGCGKTLLAKAVAGEAGVPFFSAAGAEFVESLVGVGAARVRDLFARVRAVAPAILFIDELDAAGRRRGSGSSGGGTDEREQTLNQMLVEMDGFDVSSGIVVIAATNRPDILDPALLRPGRFDRHVTIDKPDVDARLDILSLHARSRPLEPGVDLAELARRTPGFSGADLANVVNEATLLAIRDGRSTVADADLREAVQRVIGGPKRRGHLMSEGERRRIAVHEAGHAVVLGALGKAADVSRVSIVARGRAAGRVTAGGDADAVVLSLTQLEAQLVALLAGTAAEQLVLGEGSTGGEDDLERASALARDLVGRYGLSPLGRLRLLAGGSESYLGGYVALADLSPETHAAFDREAVGVLVRAETQATDLLLRHRAELDVLVERLLRDETLEGRALAGLLPAPPGADDAPRRTRRARAGTPA
jgi:cell division protease FtsH